MPGTSSEFQTKLRILRVNKSEITGENTLNGDHFGIEGNHESSKDEKICFVFFCRFLTHVLILSMRNLYLYVFRASFSLCNFQAFS